MEEDDPKPTPEPSQAPSNPHSPSTGSGQAGLTRLWAELKRRHVVRVAMVYAIVGWLVIQVAVSTFPRLSIPSWAESLVIMAVILGFPISLVVAWAFELTPEGIKTSKTAREAHPEAHKDESVQRKRNRFSLLLAAGLPTAIFGALALFFYFSRSAPTDPEPVPIEQVELENDKSIAVLPLENMSPDPENAFFADGVQEDILTHLSKIKEMGVVISRSSTLKYRDTDRNLKQVGQELGVRYIVEGSVRRAANQVLVTVQLIDSVTDDHIWAENYSRELTDIFAIQAEVAKEIAGRLKAAISPEEIEKIEYRPTQNQEAYDAYVQAKQLIEISAFTGEEKIAFLEKAVRLDPAFSEAWALLANESIFWWRFDKDRNDDELLSKARKALEEAERQAPGSPGVLYAQAQFLTSEQQDIEGSVKKLLAALAIDPHFYYAQWGLGLRYSNLGRLSEAQHYYESMLRMDPFSRRANAVLFGVYTKLRAWDKARELVRVSLQRGDDENYWLRRKLELSYLQSGDLPTFVRGLKQTPGVPGNPLAKAEIALLERDKQQALQILGDLNNSEAIDFLHGPNLIFPIDLVIGLVQFELGGASTSVGTGKARELIEARLETPRDFEDQAVFYAQLAIREALNGKRDRMEAHFVRVRELTELPLVKYRRKAKCELHIAICYLVLGENDKAIEILEAASKMESRTFVNRELDLWFIFDRLRGDPRFDALLK